MFSFLDMVTERQNIHINEWTVTIAPGNLKLAPGNLLSLLQQGKRIEAQLQTE